eukprot:gene11172-16725_t
MPEENEDARALQQQVIQMKLLHTSKEWSSKEDDKLREQVRENHKKLMSEDVFRRRKTQPLSGFQFRQEMTRIGKYSNEVVESMQQRGLGYDKLETNWHLVAKKMVERTAVDCKIRWLHALHPMLNTGDFTQDEDMSILQHAKKDGKGAYANWEEFGKTQNQNRTAVQYLKRYQMSLNPKMIGNAWSSEDDKGLKAAVEKWGEGNWNKIASELKGRTTQQCLHRWGKALQRGVAGRGASAGAAMMKKGRWSKEEDAQLMTAVEQFKVPNWRMIKTLVPTRTDAQCRERYVNCLDPALCSDSFNEVEDAMLEEAVKLHGTGNWSVVSAYMKERNTNNRTDNQILRRYKQMHPEFNKTLKKQRKLKPMATFGKRKVDRSMISPGRPALNSTNKLLSTIGESDEQLRSSTYEEMTVEELREELNMVGLPRKGKKEELLARLKHYKSAVQEGGLSAPSTLAAAEELRALSAAAAAASGRKQRATGKRRQRETAAGPKNKKPKTLADLKKVLEERGLPTMLVTTEEAGKPEARAIERVRGVGAAAAAAAAAQGMAHGAATMLAMGSSACAGAGAGAAAAGAVGAADAGGAAVAMVALGAGVGGGAAASSKA